MKNGPASSPARSNSGTPWPRRPLPASTMPSWLTRPATQAVFAALAAKGFAARAVGGAVRNALLGAGRWATSTSPPRPAGGGDGSGQSGGLAAVPTGIAHGTVTVIAERVPYEVTTLRADVETHGRHATVPSPTTGRPTRAGATSPSTLSIARRRRGFRPARRLCRYRLAARALHRRCPRAHPRGLPAHPALLPLHGRLRRRRARCRGPSRLRAEREAWQRLSAERGAPGAAAPAGCAAGPDLVDHAGLRACSRWCFRLRRGRLCSAVRRSGSGTRLSPDAMLRLAALAVEVPETPIGSRPSAALQRGTARIGAGGSAYPDLGPDAPEAVPRLASTQRALPPIANAC